VATRRPTKNAPASDALRRRTPTMDVLEGPDRTLAAEHGDERRGAHEQHEEYCIPHGNCLLD